MFYTQSNITQRHGKNWSLENNNQENEEPKENNSNNDNIQRKSSRLKHKKRMYYEKMNSGEEVVMGNTSEVSQHMAEFQHKKEDMEIKFMGFEESWWKRGILEAIQIQRINPTLNQDRGRYNLSRIWEFLAKEDNTKHPMMERSELRFPHHF